MPTSHNPESGQESLFISGSQHSDTVIPRADITGIAPEWTSHVGDTVDKLEETPLQRAQRLALVNSRGGAPDRDRLNRERAAEMGQRAFLPDDRDEEPSVDPSIGALASSAARAANYFKNPGPVHGEEETPIENFTDDPEDIRTGRREVRGLIAAMNAEVQPVLTVASEPPYGSDEWKARVLSGEIQPAQIVNEGDDIPGEDLLRIPRTTDDGPSITVRDSGLHLYG